MELGGRTLKLETGRIARQADGAVFATYGETIVLATAVASNVPREGIDFFPLTVEYREKQYAAGKIPGGFFKREGRPTEKEILSARMTDRSIRPLFPDGFNNETQVIIYVLSADQENNADTLGMIAASAALSISSIPFNGPIAAVRIGDLEGELVINPELSKIEESSMEIITAGGKESLIMVEGSMKEIPESRMLEALSLGQENVKNIVKLITELVKECGKEKQSFPVPEVDKELLKEVTSLVGEKIQKANRMSDKAKHERSDFIKQFTDELLAELEEKYPEEEKTIKGIIHDLEKEDLRKLILEENKRLDGRGPTDVREISCEIDILPRTHGSALFTRGETQSLTVITLGTKMDEQKTDGIDGESYSKYMLHYNFPPFSVGEARMIRGVSRREIGHGKLAERALSPLLPESEDFPYTIRIVSEIMESNGSSSMATVCASSLALMNAGVPIKKSVAGIAMGLITDGDKTVIISDILGTEDHIGDMDFKLAGTRDGVTAVQMDLKIDGISVEMLEKAVAQSTKGRIHIIDEMEKLISESADDISVYAPRILTLKAPIDMIGGIIGPGGKVIKKIQADTGAKVEIEDDGTIIISSVGGGPAQEAKEIIENILKVPEAGEEYEATVKKIMDFGAFVEFLPGKEGLVHISKIAYERVAKVDDVLKLGDVIKVKLLKVDNQGRYDLSMRDLLEKPEGWVDEPPRDRRPPRRDNRGGRGGGNRR
ncbi:MAG: polyribonucleotide nucleotidyltransferase [Candidatus Marinimicrobia bacterium]|nr:polyribonucleotide nucleotidyltransferase [Candidatus Neomarinimicrobiota bacterium]